MHKIKKYKEHITIKTIDCITVDKKLEKLKK